MSTNVGVVSHWSSQRLVALSSCEAELDAMNTGAAEVMGIRSLAADSGITFDFVLRTDASPALGVVHRRDVGKTRHIDTQELWLQTARRNRELEVQKVAHEENVADKLTKNVKSEVLEKHVAEMVFAKATKKGMNDELAGAQISCNSASAAKKTSALQNMVGALCIESGSRTACQQPRGSTTSW